MRMLVEVDLKQAEWIVTAYDSQDAQMIKVVEDNLDPHRHTGSLISGAPYEIVDRDNKAIGHETDVDTIAKIRTEEFTEQELATFYFPRIFSIRQGGKKSNHGLNYGMKYRRFALENEMEEREAKRIYEGYHSAYPGLKHWYGRIEEELKATRTLTNCFGEEFTFIDLLNDETLKAAYSCRPQSTVARIVLNALDNIYNNDEDILDRVWPRANVHDSLIFDVEFDNFLQGGEMLYTIDFYFAQEIEYHGRKFTLKRDIKIGHAWGENNMVEVRQTGRMEHDLQYAWQQLEELQSAQAEA